MSNCNSDVESDSGCINPEEALSASTLAILNQFLTEREAKAHEDEFISENFKFSQFWYDDETSKAIARELLAYAGDHGRIGILSAPKVLAGIRMVAPERDNVFIFEYDDRFGMKYPSEFVYYDYKHPENLPKDLHNTFDVILIDPPHLNEFAFNHYYSAIQLLGKNCRDEVTIPLMCLTGQKMRSYLKEKYLMLPNRNIDIVFESKFCTPFYYYTNRPSISHGPFLEDDEV